LRVPDDGVGVEGCGGVEPEMELLLAIAFPLAVDIGVDCVWLSRNVAQKLEVYLVVGWPLRGQLHQLIPHATQEEIFIEMI